MNGVIPWNGFYAVLWQGQKYPFENKERAERAYKMFQSGLQPAGIFISEEEFDKYVFKKSN